MQAPRLSSFAANSDTVPSLDGLRAISILFVLGQYFVSPSVPAGYGVFVFFVISGFLITRLLLAEQKSTGHISLPKFYLRRVIRLYPAVAVYTVVICTAYAISGKHITWIDPAAALFYFCNYLVANVDIHHAHLAMPEFTHIWSLSVEEQFYLVMPALLLLARTPKKLAAMAIAACLLAPALRLGFGLADPQYVGSHFFYVRIEFRMDSLAFGVLLAAVCECRPDLVRRLGLPITFLVFAALTALSLTFPGLPKLVLRDTFMGLFVMSAIAGIVFNGRFWPASAVLNSAPMVWIGRLSYSIYVWHYGIVLMLQPRLTGIPFRVVGLGLVFAAASISYYGIEKPLLAFRAKFRAVNRPRETSWPPPNSPAHDGI
jgi:peptidoglycan/LPS O-acetylase OafA/YrhL